jgi:outer membrane protein OmpA-like peptidoglycan-associated protein/opacity protein-like surface antigen
MNTLTLRGMSYCGGAAALCMLLARVAAAQVPQATVGAAASAPEVLQAGTVELGGAEATTSDAGESGDFLYRYKPQANLVEIGAFLGALFISDSNSFRGRAIANPGGPPTVKPVSTFNPAPELGVRAGYYPLSFLGGELEGMLAIAETDAGEGATVLGARAQAVVQLPYWSVVPFALAGVGYWNVLNDVSGDDSDPAFHFGGGAKVNVTRNLAVRVDVRDSITSQRGNVSYPHNVEALAGASLVLGREQAPQDSDADGVFDDRDQCPLEAGTPADGCPIRDSDADGIMDPADQCVQQPGVAPTGCPILDVDADGVLDTDDQCLSVPGIAPTGCPDTDRDGFLDSLDKCPAAAGVSPDGCPANPDPDGDGVLGAKDSCPDQAETKNGFEDADGCPDELPAVVKAFMGVIAGIEFDNNKATIRPGSDAALNKALSVLKEYPSLRIEIIGHTDNRGAREHNVDLSQRRADAIKAYLATYGVDPSRIQTTGAGPDSPLTSNDTKAGRQKNRRIEFRVIRE